MGIPFVCIDVKPASCVLSVRSWESILNIQEELMNRHLEVDPSVRGQARDRNLRALADRWWLRSWGRVHSLRERYRWSR